MHADDGAIPEHVSHSHILIFYYIIDVSLKVSSIPEIELILAEWDIEQTEKALAKIEEDKLRRKAQQEKLWKSEEDK